MDAEKVVGITSTDANLRKNILMFVLMMIFAVEQRGEPMSDLIDRQAAIDALQKEIRAVKALSENEVRKMEHFRPSDIGIIKRLDI